MIDAEDRALAAGNARKQGVQPNGALEALAEGLLDGDATA